MKRLIVWALGMVIIASSLGYTDVKHVSETLFNLEGTMGKMMKFMGAAKPIKTVDYYKNEMKRSDSFDKKGKVTTSQIINIKDKVFISIDHKRKNYTQMTFDEWTAMMKSTMEQFSQGDMGEVDEAENEKPDAEIDWDLKVDVKKTGETETVGGKKCEKVILTLDMDAEVTSTNTEDGDVPETAKGGMIVTSTHWLYKGGDKAKKEMADFNLKLAKKLEILPGKASFKDMMAQIVEGNPQLGEAMEKMKNEGGKLDGFAMRVHTAYETKVDPETAKRMNEEKAKQDDDGMEIPTSVGGLLGGFGKKMAKKKMQKNNEVKERNALMQSDTKVLEMGTSTLERALFGIPSGYNLVKNEN
jgi:hypothetical protein